MAMSFARPDPSSPASVADAGFGTSRRGFDQDEVRDFLRMVAAELGRLQERERFLERELRSVQSNPDLESVQFDDQTLTRLLGEETTRVLTTARESASEIRTKAEQSAAQMLGEAGDEASRVREEAEVEASRRRADAGADAEAELAMAKQQGREMVNEARAYRERVLSELARRRELAREQIEQLLHGRDRLMRSFEQARLVAVDVVAELQPLGEPDEYVNLSPTTGPVPVMLPNSPRPDSSAPALDETPASDDGEQEIDAEPSDSVESGDAEVVQLVQTRDSVDSEHESEDAQSVETATANDEVDEPEQSDAAEQTGVAEATDDEVEDLWSEDSGRTSDGDERIADVGAEESGAEDDPEVDGRDDVVVDLFARLRAGTESDDEIDQADDAGDVADDGAGDVADNEDGTQLEVDEVVGDESGDDKALDDDAEPTPFEQRDADLTPLIVASAKKLKRVLADEQNEVLDALRQKVPITEISALLPTADEHVIRYSDAIADDMLIAAKAGSASVASGKSAKLLKADATKATTAASEILGEWLVAPLRERLDRCVSQGDGDNVEITKRVRAVYRECKTQHIDEQLDDVVRAAHGRGLLAALTDGSSAIWTADSAHSVCADCDDNTLAGPVVVGEKFPTGHVFAPAHIGCRCLLVPASS
jgi:DivIVA domain-containing protein